MPRMLVLSVIFLLVTCGSSPADQYVRCDAPAGGDGTIGAPWNRVQTGLDHVQAGETLFIHDEAICRTTSRIKTQRPGPVTVLPYGGGGGVWKVRGSELFSAGWTDTGGNRWTHALATNPGRMVFINGTHKAAWAETGACPEALDQDQEFCWKSGTLYVHSKSNPATRWIAPGVEVVSQLAGQEGDARVLLQISHTGYTLEHGQVAHSGSATLLLKAGAALTLTHMELAWSWLGNHSATFQGGSALLNMQLSEDIEAVTIRKSSLHDCGRDCLHTSGGTGTLKTLMVEDSEIFNAFNHGIVGVISGTTIHTATFRRVLLRDACAYVGQTNTAGDNNAHINTLVLEAVWVRDAVLDSDPRVFAAKEECGTKGPGVHFNGASRATTTTIRQSLLTGLVIGVDGDGGHKQSRLTAEHNVFAGNARIGLDLSAFGGGMVVKDNIFSQNGLGTSTSIPETGQITCREAEDCGTFTQRDFSGVDHNLYDPPGSLVVAYINQPGQGERTFAQWQEATGADGKGLAAAPEFVAAWSGDFNLLATSPAFAAASDGTHIGALQTPRLVSAVLTPAGTLRLSITPASRLSACLLGQMTLVCTQAGTIAPAGPCTVTGEGQAEVPLSTPVSAGDTCTLVLPRGVLQDSVWIGGRVNAGTVFQSLAGWLGSFDDQ